MDTLRRSSRPATVMYDSNGRDYLGFFFGWSRQEIESWLQSANVRPHLQLWYQLCISNKKRFDDAVEWIDDGASGYFYHETGLQEDLLLACLGEGGTVETNAAPSAYAAADIMTVEWPTQELWARTVWRIVQDNVDGGDVFHHAVHIHPAAVFALVIDVLSLAFHSIAHRAQASVWYKMINELKQATALSPDVGDAAVELEIDRFASEQKGPQIETADSAFESSAGVSATAVPSSEEFNISSVDDSEPLTVVKVTEKGISKLSASHSIWEDPDKKRIKDWIHGLTWVIEDKEELVWTF